MVASVCFIATEFFGWGRYGGFGKCTRVIASGLAHEGFEVHVVVPRGKNQNIIEKVDGVTVHSFPLIYYPLTGKIYRKCDSEIYHSEDPNWGSLIALNSMQQSVHLVTCQNPKSRDDWKLVERYYPIRRRLFNRFYDHRIKSTLKQMDGVYCQARHIIPKARVLYDLKEDPGFLPNPVDVPKRLPNKAERPTICFLGRLDREKRPELFFQLARIFPKYRFIVVGKAHDYKRNKYLKKISSKIPNLDLIGFKTGIQKNQILDKSWILVNTSVSECLPISFLEAAAHGCAILSFHDPDEFASNFGYKASQVDELSFGLRELVKNSLWREKGILGYKYVKKVHEKNHVINLHIKKYERYLFEE